MFVGTLTVVHGSHRQLRSVNEHDEVTSQKEMKLANVVNTSWLSKCKTGTELQ